MEPTRTGSFDDMMYGDYLALSDEADCTHSGGSQAITQPDDWILDFNEVIEHQIADSHDITKSNFGFK